MFIKYINSLKNLKKIEDIAIIIAVTLIGILFLSYFRTKHSMGFMNLDELLWMYRSRFFMDNLFDFNFSGLLQTYHPGTMVMWLAGPFMKIINYDFNSISNFISNLNASGVGYNVINHKNQLLYADYKGISLLFNVPILSLIFIFIFSTYHLLKKLKFNKWAIIFSLLLITTTPYYIYFTTPTDKLVGIFSVLSVLCLLVFASGKGRRKFFIISAVLCSFSVLSKFSALFLIPFSLFVLVSYKTKVLSPRNKSILFTVYFLLFTILKNTIKTIKIYFAWLTIFSVTTIVFLPTIVTNPSSVLDLIIKQSSQRIITENHSVLFSPNVALAYLSDSFALSFNLFIIIIFIGFLLLIIRRLKDRINVNKEVLILAIYFFSFFIFVILFSKTYSFRYLVPALIVFQIISGIGIYEFANIFIKRNNITNKKLVYLWAIVFILISQGLLIYYSEIEKIESLPYFG